MSERVYKASACGPGCEQELDHGTLTVSANGASFSGPRTAFTLPLDGLKMVRAGATADTLQLSHPSYPGHIISTLDLALLTDPVLRSQSDLRRTLAGHSRRGPCCIGGCLGALLVLVLLVVGFFLAKDAIVGALTRHFPQEYEQKVGNLLLPAVLPPGKQMDDPALVEQLNMLADPVLKAVPATAGFTTFTLHLASDPVPNAFAIPGGHIIVNSGLIKLADTPEQVVGVIAHEAGHAAMRHGLQSLISRAGTAAVLQLVLGDASGLAGVLHEGGGYLLNQKYSRDYERQADEKAWDYMMAANVNPAGLGQFFAKLEQEQGVVPPEILSTHPNTAARRDELQRRLKALPADQQWRNYAKTLDFQQFKQDVQSAAEKN